MPKSKTALITGSTSGIGLGIARALAADGCDVVLNGFGDAGEIERIRAAIERDHPVRARYEQADLTKPAEIESLIKRIGTIDVLVNNAGIQHPAPIEQLPPDKWDAIIALNLTASFHTIRHALPAMRSRGWGRIINIASVHGLVASINKAAYVAAKHGLVGLTKVVALESAGSGVTCNAICPGFTRTPLIEPQVEARAKQLGVSKQEGERDLLAEKQPSRQLVETEQIGALAVFLCSEAAKQITGSAMTIDGGWTAQ